MLEDPNDSAKLVRNRSYHYQMRHKGTSAESGSSPLTSIVPDTKPRTALLMMPDELYDYSGIESLGRNG